MSHGVCRIHAGHRPRVTEVDVHHIWPRGMGGPDTPANRIPVCPTGHRNVHELLREWLRYAGEPSWEIRRAYHPAERVLAEQGYLRSTPVVIAGEGTNG